MSINDYREIGADRLAVKVAELEAAYLAAREAVMSGKEKNHAQLKPLKRQIAQAKTILHQLQLEEPLK